MQRIEIRRVSRDGATIQTTIIQDGGPDDSAIQESANAFAAILEQGRRRRRWLAGIGAVVLFLEGVILFLWPWAVAG